LKSYKDIVDKTLKTKIAELVGHNYDYKLLKKFFKDRKNTWKDKDVSRVEIYYWDDSNVASRVALDTSFVDKKIESITDIGIQKILLRHKDATVKKSEELKSLKTKYTQETDKK